METNRHQWIRYLTLTRTFRCHPKSQRNIIHRIDNHSLILRRILRNSSHPRLWNVIPIEILLLSCWLHPYLVLGIRSQVIEGRYMQNELIWFREFAKTCANRYQIFLLDILRQLQNPLGDIIDAVFIFSKAICPVRTIDQQFYVGTDAGKWRIKTLVTVFWSYGHTRKFTIWTISQRKFLSSLLIGVSSYFNTYCHCTFQSVNF